MAIKQKPFSDAEKAALRKNHLRPEDWEPVWRDSSCSTFIVKRKGGYEIRTIEK